MGKQQQRKKQDRKASRHNPVRVPDGHLAHGIPQGKEQTVLPIIAKLGAADAEDRVWACAAITNLIQNDPATRRLLQSKGVVSALIARLSDSVEDVLVEACGALRNLCIDGGYDLCAEIYNKGVLSPLSALIPQITNTLNGIFTSAPLDPKKDLVEIRKRKLVYDLSENVITILWCLSETSEKALTAVNNLTLVPFLVSFLSSRNSLPLSLTTAAAQCLYVLTEDNPPAYKHLRSEPGWINTLIEVVREGWEKAAVSSGKGKGKAAAGGMEGVEEGERRDMLLRILAAGTIRHISPLPVLMPAAALDLDTTLFIPLLDQALGADLGEVTKEVERLSAELPDAAAIAAQIKSPQTDHKTDGERALEAIESRLTTLQVGLEVLMGICSKVPDGPLGGDDVEDDAAVEELEVDGEGMEDEEEEELDADVLIAEGRDQEVIQAGSATSSPLPPVLEAFLTTLSLPSRLLSLATPTALSFLPLSSSTPPTSSPSPHPPTTAVLSTIHLRALETLNNLLISTSFFVPAPTSSAFKSVEWQTFFDRSPGLLQPTWDGLFALAATVVPSVEVQEVKGQEVRKELVDATMSCLMGVSALTRGAVRLAPGQVEGLISAVGASERESFRTRVLGTLGALAMNDRAGQDAIQTNKTIGTYLVQLLVASKPAISPESLVVVLNAIFDVYADETAVWDGPVFRQGGFLPALKSVVPKVRGITRGIDKRKNPELRARADEAYENLIAFCKYRQSVA